MKRRGMVGKFREFLRQDDSGSATIEFVLIFPAITFFMFAYAEVGTLAARSVLLEQGLDIAFREVRLGNIPSRPDLTNEEIHRQIKIVACTNAFFLSTCMDDLNIELIPVPLGDPLPLGGASCRDRLADVDPAISIGLGNRVNPETQIMLARSCFVVNPIFPYTGIGAGLQPNPGGGYRIMFETAFLNEPS